MEHQDFLDALYQPENFGMAILANETSKTNYGSFKINSAL
jgi:hypothetical protein